MQYSNNSKYIVTNCIKETKIWKVSGSIAGVYASIPAETALYTEIQQKPLAALNNDGGILVIYRDFFILDVYAKVSEGNFELQTKIDLVEQINENIDKDFLVT